MQGPSVIGAALALRDTCKDQPYKIVIYGTPAEETIGGKIIMQEKGCFKDIDIALMMHAAPSTCVDLRCMALECFYVTFHGVESHAAMSHIRERVLSTQLFSLSRPLNLCVSMY